MRLKARADKNMSTNCVKTHEVQKGSGKDKMVRIVDLNVKLEEEEKQSLRGVNL